MKTQTKALRDFIYLDVDWLYSLYSQVFEGIAEKIVQSYLDGLQSIDTQKPRPLSGKDLQTGVSEFTSRTENKILYDHMYNQLEAQLAEAILVPNNISSDNYREKLSSIFMLKVSGSAEIEDYDRLKDLLVDFNTLGEALAYIQTYSDAESLANLQDVENVIAQTTDRNQKAKLAKKLGRAKNATTLAKERGLHYDENFLKHLNYLIEKFYVNTLEVVLVPESGIQNIAFRGVLNRQWLRIFPTFLRTLYRGYVESNWTMVGQITYLPDRNLPEEIPTPEKSKNDEENGNTTETDSTFRDAFRNMFLTAMGVEQSFLETKNRVEILVRPLAIYREQQLPDFQKRENEDGRVSTN